MSLKLKQLQGTGYMWRELFAKLEGFEYFTLSFQFLCLDVLTKYGQWLAYCQVFKTLFLHDLIISRTTKLSIESKQCIIRKLPGFLSCYIYSLIYQKVDHFFKC